MKTPMLVIDPLMLKKLRRDGGYTQKALAVKSRVALGIILEFEALADAPDIDRAAREKDFRISTANKLAKALGVSAFVLLKEVRDL